MHHLHIWMLSLPQNCEAMSCVFSRKGEILFWVLSQLILYEFLSSFACRTFHTDIILGDPMQSINVQRDVGNATLLTHTHGLHYHVKALHINHIAQVQ